jgi:hypothetical protein
MSEKEEEEKQEKEAKERLFMQYYNYREKKILKDHPEGFLHIIPSFILF